MSLIAMNHMQLAIEKAQRLRYPNRATTPDAAEALTALQDRDGEPRGMTPEEPTLLAESRSPPPLPPLHRTSH